jgi:hypothetical protein
MMTGFEPFISATMRLTALNNHHPQYAQEIALNYR